MESPINQTLSSLSQAIQFLVDNDFLDGVELHEGDFVEATSRGVGEDQKLVQVVESAAAKPDTEVKGHDGQKLVQVVDEGDVVSEVRMEGSPERESKEAVTAEEVPVLHPSEAEGEAEQHLREVVKQAEVPVLPTAGGEEKIGTHSESIVPPSESVAPLIEGDGADDDPTVNTEPSELI